ncbi:MAG: 4Fe-4S dicluster domain-containing protein [Coriobacteriaceae bacterium]|nr:4Fe-4S dicluster domain-containing protein [Coriobacteriaceae bacterium]
MSSKCVVADPRLCIGCRTCMAACIEKHDVAGDAAVARLNLAETIKVSAPIVCHHCVDAPCVNACPQGALFYDGDRVAVNMDRCIGCRSCVMACPYGACDVVSRLESVVLGDLVLADKAVAKVIKCDLCADVAGGPRCVKACPTNGLRVVDQDDLKNMALDRRRAAAESLEPMMGSTVYELV